MVSISGIKEKILLCLLSGIAFGYSYTPDYQWRVIRTLGREWRRINEKELRREIKNLYKSKMVTKKQNPDGSFTILLTKKGKIKALTFRLQDMKIKGETWDKRWRVVIFDIPEKLKKARDALREKLKKIGFYELQKSVFVFPYECEEEIDFVIEFFELRKYVRFGVLEKIDNEPHLKKIFSLI